MTTANAMDISNRDQTDERLQQFGRSDAGQGQQAHRSVNVGGQERLISAGAGTLLALYGLKRMTLGGLLVGAGGVMLLKRATTGHCNIYEKLGLNTATGEGAQPHEYFERGIHVEESFTIQKSPDELYAFWHKFENLPRFMKHLHSVTTIDAKKSHWVADGPGGYKVEWDAEIINDEPNKTIAWRSLGGAEVDNAGSVTFRAAPGDRGTEVAVTLDYIPPGGTVGSVVAKLFGRDPDTMIREDLRNFKRLMETGEIPTTQGQPRGTCDGGGQRHSGY